MTDGWDDDWGCCCPWAVAAGKSGLGERAELPGEDSRNDESRQTLVEDRERDSREKGLEEDSSSTSGDPSTYVPVVPNESSSRDDELTDNEVEPVLDDHEQPSEVALSQSTESLESTEDVAEESESDEVAAVENESEPESTEPALVADTDSVSEVMSKEEEEDSSRASDDPSTYAPVVPNESSSRDDELTDNEVEPVPDDHEQPSEVALSQSTESLESTEGVAEESASDTGHEVLPIDADETSESVSDDERAGSEEGKSTDRVPAVALAAEVDELLLLAEATFQEHAESEGGAVSAGIELAPESPVEGAPVLEDSFGTTETQIEGAPEVSSVEIQAILEAVLYAAGEPVTLREMKKILFDVPPERVKRGIESLLETYTREGRGLHIFEVAGGYQVTTRPEYHERVSAMFKAKPPTKLTIQALETLASIAYRQPVTVPEIMELRGVRSASVVRTLLERKLIRIVGRKNVVGRPLLYGTTKDFLVRFGLKDLNELPRLEDMADVFGEDLSLPVDAVNGDETPAASESGESAENLDRPSSSPTHEASESEEPNHEKDPIS